MAKTIVEFSGGLDSTYALYDILSNTSDEVVCIHFDHSYHTERFQNLVSPSLQSEMHQYQTALVWRRTKQLYIFVLAPVQNMLMITASRR